MGGTARGSLDQVVLGALDRAVLARHRTYAEALTAGYELRPPTHVMVFRTPKG